MSPRKLMAFFLVIAWIVTACSVLSTPAADVHPPTPTSTAKPEKTLQSSPTLPIPNTPIKTTPTSSMAIDNLPELKDLPNGWSLIPLDYPTSCARGTSYYFFVRKTESDDLLIYFEGGGSCASAETCRVGSNHFDDSIDPNYEADNPALKKVGIFAFDDSRNPFQNDNIVFISYCTGDAFLGQETVAYNDQGNQFEVNHFGAINTREVFNWIFRNFENPQHVSVIGCSAGVVGSATHVPAIFKNYPSLEIPVIGDSGAGYFDAPIEFLESNGALDLILSISPEYQTGISDGIYDISKLFTIPANQYPRNTLTLVDTFSDSTQKGIIEYYNSLVGDNLSLEELIMRNLDQLQTEAPSIRSFTGPGDYHCITMRSEFYEYQVNNVYLADWIEDLKNGKNVENISP